MTVRLFLLLLALVLFLVAGLGVASSRFNLVAFGLASLTASFLFG